MATNNEVSHERVLYPNIDKVYDFIESEPDEAVRSLMRLVHSESILAGIQGKHPETSIDWLYCFEILQTAFRRKDALEQALKGNYGDPNAELEWT